jgi:hypothetical protein
MAEALSSDWGLLSKYLIASFYEVKRDGTRVDPNVTVKAPLSEANLDVTLNWQSPFEQAGAESKAPTLFAMVQSGALQPVADVLGGALGQTVASALNLESTIQSLEGKTGVTKLNSTQVFNGMPPVKIQITAVFRAWKDPQKEVEDPVNQLMTWALPVKLEGDSTALSRLAKDTSSPVDALLPSQSPTMIAMEYKGRLFSPLVIEQIGNPLSSPIDVSGRYVELSIPMSLATLTAIDRADWDNSKQQGWNITWTTTKK